MNHFHGNEPVKSERQKNGNSVCSFQPSEELKKKYINAFNDTADPSVALNFARAIGDVSKVHGLPYTFIFMSYFMRYALDQIGEIDMVPESNYNKLVAEFDEARNLPQFKEPPIGEPDKPPRVPHDAAHKAPLQNQAMIFFGNFDLSGK